MKLKMKNRSICKSLECVAYHNLEEFRKKKIRLTKNDGLGLFLYYYLDYKPIQTRFFMNYKSKSFKCFSQEINQGNIWSNLQDETDQVLRENIKFSLKLFQMHKNQQNLSLEEGKYIIEWLLNEHKKKYPNKLIGDGIQVLLLTEDTFKWLRRDFCLKTK